MRATKMTMKPLGTWSAVAVLLATGCGGGTKPEPGDPGGGDSGPGDAMQIEGYQCERDPALLDTHTRCRLDVHCPCGAHCASGVCRFACQSHSDCGEGWCDYFGRCRSDDDRASIAGVMEVDVGVLTVSPEHVDIYAWSKVHQITLRAEHADIPELRLLASYGLEVACGDAWTDDCLLGEGLAAGLELPVEVRVTERGAMQRDAWKLAIYYGDALAVVGLTRAVEPRLSPVEPGVYHGQIWLAGLEATLQTDVPDTDAQLTADFSMLNVPVELRVYGGLSPKLVIDDEAGVLPDHWVFNLRPDGTFDGLAGAHDQSTRTYVYSAPSGTPEATTEVTVAGRGEVRLLDTTLSGVLEMPVGGIGLTYAPAMMVDERPRVLWKLAAGRVADLPDGETPPVLGDPDPLTFNPTSDRYDDDLPWAAELATCAPAGLTGVGADIVSRVQGLLCYNHPSADLSTVAFGSTALLNLHGDVNCEGGVDVRPTAFPFFTYGDRSGASLTSWQLLDDCRWELGYVHGTVPVPVNPTGPACMNELSGCGPEGLCEGDEMPKCVDGPVALSALGLGMNSIERRGAPDNIHWLISDEAGARMGLRVLQQWLQVHTFLAREATQESDAYLGITMADLDAALAGSLRGWHAVLHPKVAGRLLHVSPALLNRADYRGFDPTTVEMSLDLTQAVGIPVVMLEAVRAQVDAAVQLVRRARFESAGVVRVPAAVPETLRYAALVIPIAEMLYQRAGQDSEDVLWDDLWAESIENLAESQRALLREWRDYRDGRNPLGIEDEDLPLYRGLMSPDGAAARFAAISSYIVDNFAADAVQKAALAKDAADAAWLQLLGRALQADISQSTPDRVAEIRRVYGEKILSLCGNPLALRADEVLTAWPDLSPANCFMNPVLPACLFDEQGLLDTLSMDDIGYQLCVQSRVQAKVGTKARLSADYVNGWIEQINGDLADFYDPDQGHPWFRSGTSEDEDAEESEDSSDDGETWWQQIDPGTVEAVVDYQECATAESSPEEDSCKLADLMVLESYEASTPEDEQAFLDARSSCGAMFRHGPTLEQRAMNDPALNDPGCYQGSLGELVLAARSAAKDVEAATSALEDYTSMYESAMWKCTLDDRLLEMETAVTDQLTALTDQLNTYTNTGKVIVDVSKTVFSVAAPVIAALAPKAKPPAGTTPTPPAGGQGKADGIGKKVEQVNSILDMVSGHIFTFQDQYLGITNINQMHADFLADFQDRMGNVSCFHDAEQHLIGANTQARRVEQAKIDLSRAVLQIRNGQAQVAQLVADGRYRAEGEEGRQRASLFNDIWSDLWAGSQQMYKGKVEAYRRAMRLAQRMTYLAARAIEYELQASLEERYQILAAREPGDLEIVLIRLRSILGAGDIGGQRPDDRHVELSLKDNLLQLADRADLGAGLHTMNPTERFRAILTSTRFAHHDEEGNYLGQLIPFSVAPLGVLGLGDPGTVALLTGTECAERLWRVNLSLQGDDVMDGDTTYVQVGLLQKNDFYSQWCLEPAAGQNDVQNASVRPARNLFKDPIWGGNYGVTAADDSEYVIALVDAYLNVPWSDFQDPDYDSGAKEALATRALYGEYALFFPAQRLSISGGPGLHLNRLDDVWLRLDYVSAARQWQ